MGTMVFFTNVMVGDKTYDQATGPLAIGLTVFQGIIAGKWIGAGCLNPSRAIGPAVVLGGKAWSDLWVWWVGDCLGAFIFSIIYMMFFAPPEKNWMIRMDTLSCSQGSSTKSIKGSTTSSDQENQQFCTH